MEIDQTEGIFERTERSFDPPTHGIELLKISKKSVFWRKESGDRENTATTLRVERSTIRARLRVASNSLHAVGSSYRCVYA